MEDLAAQHAHFLAPRKGGLPRRATTSVQMIEQFYSAHIKYRLDASAINVMRPKAVRKAARKSEPKEQSAPQAHH